MSQDGEFFARYGTCICLIEFHRNYFYIHLHSKKGAILMRELISGIIIFIGIAFIALGIIGIYRFNNFYSRALVASKVDTVGYITIIIGVMIRHGFSYFTMKVFFILLITLIINPLITHSIVRSAFISGYKLRKE
jgi:multicomponent Na+:H+ antiporter subunit G